MYTHNTLDFVQGGKTGNLDGNFSGQGKHSVKFWIFLKICYKSGNKVMELFLC